MICLLSNCTDPWSHTHFRLDEKRQFRAEREQTLDNSILSLSSMDNAGNLIDLTLDSDDEKDEMEYDLSGGSAFQLYAPSSSSRTSLSSDS